MHVYDFKIDERGKMIIAEIVEAIQNEFHLTHDAAVEMVNRHWKGQDLCGNRWLGHFTSEKWAFTIASQANQNSPEDTIG